MLDRSGRLQAGSRRRSYLILNTALAALGLGLVYFLPPQSESAGLLPGLVLVPTVGVAFSDGVVDALMVERGRPLGLTGRLQSVQWAAMYAAMIATGFVGGWLSQHQRQGLGFLICATAMAGFLFLWNFNPFSSSVQYVCMTGNLIQLDLAARICPPKAAGTIFAVLMAISNSGIVLSTALGGLCYDRLAARWDPHLAFDALVALGTAFTAACWLLVPLLESQGRR